MASMPSCLSTGFGVVIHRTVPLPDKPNNPSDLQPNPAFRSHYRQFSPKAFPVTDETTTTLVLTGVFVESRSDLGSTGVVQGDV